MMMDEETAWVRCENDQGVAELHLTGDRWEVWVKTRGAGNGDLKLGSSGKLNGVTIGTNVVPFAPRENRRIVVGSLDIEPASRAVTVDGRDVRLTDKEYQLLLMLASEPARVFTKVELLREVWGFRSIGHTRTLDTHASRLRRKLAGDGPTLFVVNCWGVGYRMVEAVEAVVA